MSTPNPLRNTPYAIRITFYALLLLMPLLAALPLWGPGMVNTRGGGDSPFLLQRTLDMAEALRHGHVPPRWMAHAAYDLGYPFFNHYAALPFYLSGGLTALGFSPILAIQATQTFGFLLAALTMALWAQRVYGNRWATLLAVAAYTFAPFHLVNVYVRGDSLSEFWAFVWYPLILWTLARAAERPSLRRTLFAALSYAALILTHNVSALIFAPFALLYAASQQEDESANQRISESAFHVSRITHYVVRITSPFLLAFLLTAWFWMPAIGETGYGQMGPEFTAGYFHYSNHFRGLNLVQPTFFFNYDIAPAVGEAGPFAMGLVQAVLAALGMTYCVFRITYLRKTEYGIRNTQYKFILFSLALSTLMITPLSALLWEHLPLLATTQFPWRFLSVQALFTAIATGALANRQISESANRQENEKTRKRKYAIRNTQYAVSIALVFGLALAALGALRPDRLLITAEDVTWDNFLLYEAFTGNIGTTIRYEYLPRDVQPRLYISEAVVDGVDAAQPIADGDVALTATLLARAPQRQVWRVALDGAAPVVFPLHWWPGWHAEVNGVTADAYPLTGSGRLTVDLAAGEHEIVLRLRNTPLRATAGWILVVTVLALGVVVFQRRGAEAQRRRGLVDFLKAKHLPVSALMGAFALALILPALFTPSPPRPLAPALTAFDFIHAPYPHHEPVRFGPLLLEEVYVTSGESRNALNIVAAPGEQIGLGLRWQLADSTPLTGTLRLVSPAEPRHGVTYSLAETTFAVATRSGAGYSLTLPPSLARGLYLLELRFYDAEGELHPQTPQGAGRGTLYVGAVRVQATPLRRLDAPLVAQLGELTLHSATPLSSSPDTLRLLMSWSLARRTPRNWSLSLRLLDADGRQLSQVDMQPGYGYLPTTLWHAGEFVTDYPVLPVPEGLAPGEYTLRVIAYLEATMQPGGEADVPIRLTSATLRESPEAEPLCQAGGVSLTGLHLPEAHPEGAPLDFTAEWNATEQPTANLTARWEAVDAAGNAVALREGPLAPGSRTSDWPRFAWVRAPVTLPLPPLLPAGPYILRLTLLAGEAILQSCELGALDIAPRPRSFDLPAPPFPQQADFGAELRLLGYDIAQSSDVLTLTLWWQAQAAPTRDYKRFVHLLAPSGELIAQDDAMPRAWTYPTSWWVAGEVVSETVTLPAPPAGYRLGVGWYDGETGITLPATDATGAPWPDNRVILSAPEER